MRLRSTVFILALSALFSLASPGCAVFKGLMPAPVAAGQDPVLANAQRSLEASFLVVDQFLSIEDAHRAEVKAELPAVHSFAEGLRANAKDQFRTAWAAVAAYQAASAPAKEAAATDLNAQLDQIDKLAAQARAFIATITAHKPATSAILERPPDLFLQAA